MPGFLVPVDYRPEPLNELDMQIASIAWGFSLGTIIFNTGKALQQTVSTFRRKKRFTFYISLLWLEICSSLSLSIICWMYLRSYIQPSMQYFFFVIVAWSTQVQCLIQIIINRVGLLMHDRQKATRLKWGCFLTLLTINISVFCIWIPARLQINKTYIHLNDVWDRCEKVIFGIMDASLNIAFIYTVKKRLIENGLKKYTKLYHANLVLAILSIGLDILLISMMSLPNSFVYIQFHPLVYLLKLHIEMNMAELIGKVVRATNPMNNYGGNSEVGTTRSRTQNCKNTLTAARRSRMDPDDEEKRSVESRHTSAVGKAAEKRPARPVELSDEKIAGECHHRNVSEASSSKQTGEP